MKSTDKIKRLHGVLLECLDHFSEFVSYDYQGPESGYTPDNRETELAAEVKMALEMCGLNTKGMNNEYK